MSILDAIKSNPGSFLAGFQAETDKRDALAAQESARLAELAKEDRAFARQKELKRIELGHQESMADYSANIAEGVEKNRRKYEAEVKLLKFQQDMFTKDKETFNAHLKTMGEKGIIYPDGLAHDWHWHYAEVVDVPEEERDQYDGHDKRLDLENPQKFGQFEFMDACKAMGLIIEDG